MALQSQGIYWPMKSSGCYRPGNLKRPIRIGGPAKIKGKKEPRSSQKRLSAVPLILVAVIILLASVPVRPLAGEPPDDLQIKTAVEAVIEKDGHLDLDELQVSCHNGTVTLAGTVLTGDEKALAGVLAMQVPGVRAIENDIEVSLPLSQDVELEKLAEETILENPLLRIMDLKIRSRQGVVTLRGIVFEESESRLASQLLSELPGVVGVINKIEVLV